MNRTKILLKPKRETPLDKYSGKWVAFIDDKVIASDKTLEGLMLKVKKMGLEKKVVVFLVPRKDEGPYILKFQVPSTKLQTSTKF